MTGTAPAPKRADVHKPARLSLRAQIFLGALLWTAGLFTAAAVAVTFVMYHHPSTPRMFHAPFLYFRTASVIAVLCMIAGFLQVRKGLSAVQQLRERLAAVHQGRERFVEGRYPAEVQPLVHDLNTLLEHRGQAVARALAKAGDLAHGLKTPLAVIAQEAERARAAGQIELADAVHEQVERMQRQIDYHLAHARAAASGTAAGARSVLAESADGLARTLLRLHAGRGLAIDVGVPPQLSVRCQREDLDEILGNLLDNACKWGKSRVALSARGDGGSVIVTVDDDGPGIDAAKRDLVLQRGVRADETAPGSGFGLAIVTDLAELYGGALALESSPLGGLRVRLTLPAA
ncbi:MAG TPA: ATP-binding protein [Vicinamibacterales bacterium]|nr:ATP-binding protein [Vicinamibacterales bacterium]